MSSFTYSHQPFNTLRAEDDEEDQQLLKKMRPSASRESFSLLTRATSIMTWDSRASDMSSKYDVEAQRHPILSKKHSLQSLTGFTILPTIYGSTCHSEDDDLSECSYVTTRTDGPHEAGSDISFASTKQSYASTTSEEADDYDDDDDDDDDGDDSSFNMKNIFQEQKHKDQQHRLHEQVASCKINSDSQNLFQHIVSTTHMVKTKSKGVKPNEPVVQFEISECFWTFSGSFTIIFLLCFLSANITLWNDHGHAFPLGPFGALTTLQYSLGEAAPAQPRNVILGSTLSGSIALCSTYLSEEYVPPSVRIALATSLSIAMMARFGIMHPPGGAIAVVFASGHYHWGHLLLTLCGCSIAVCLATIVNNLNRNRHYPQYWDFAAALRQSLF